MAYNGSRVQVGPGTLYVAPLGTTEPTAVTGAWPAGWVPIGYTDQGNDSSFTPTIAAIEVEEERWPVRNEVVTYKGTVAFAIAERTATAFAIAMNAGVPLTSVSNTGSNSDGSVWVEPPTPGTEVRIMLGWDALPKGASSGANPFGRTIYRQAIQSGDVKQSHRKGNNKTTFTVSFELELPPSGLQAFREIFPASLSS